MDGSVLHSELRITARRASLHCSIADSFGEKNYEPDQTSDLAGLKNAEIGHFQKARCELNRIANVTE
jgi:hypothetical protein